MDSVKKLNERKFLDDNYRTGLDCIRRKIQGSRKEVSMRGRINGWCFHVFVFVFKISNTLKKKNTLAIARLKERQ